jgi:hypothetical protein
MRTALINLNKSLDVLDELMKKLVSPNSESAIDLSKFGFNLFVHKTYWNLKSSQLILNHFNSNYNHALGLVFRSILTDFFLVMNIFLNSNSPEELDSFMLALFKDSEKKIDGHVNLMENSGMYSSDYISKARDNLNNDLHLVGFIRSKEISQIKLPFLTTEIFKNLIFKPNLDQQYKDIIKKAFDLWKLYSQYEHFGLSTIEVTNNVSQELFDSRIESILMFSMITIDTCLNAMDKLEEKQRLSDFLDKEF